MKKLFTVPGRSSPGLAKLALPPSFLSGTALAQRYSTQDDDSREIVDKARSTAEEFLRQAKQKAESLKEAAKDTKESLVGESKAGKEYLKEKVEKGKSDRD
ncbi:uncharacterized protein LOC110092416 [Dendrobium catenatum]|uniref:Uncharacterized protein n=1 Tax=Dendrobium catenatum TaxID=906689 RepID=A0A2I0XGV6_9ASPA|nr:uncharacterized protein LOC110092416 [Dendrobium catenatum]PKU87147.1 hypothetical protein MA16_Dca006556 [Dendrobium catenatum]